MIIFREKRAHKHKRASNHRINEQNQLIKITMGHLNLFYSELIQYDLFRTTYWKLIPNSLVDHWKKINESVNENQYSNSFIPADSILIFAVLIRKNNGWFHPFYHIYLFFGKFNVSELKSWKKFVSFLWNSINNSVAYHEFFAH